MNASFAAVNCARFDWLPAPRLGIHRYDQFGISEDSQIRAVRRENDLSSLLGPLQVPNHGLRDIPRVQMILGLVED